MKIMLDKGAIVPVRAHTWDAGLDLFTPGDPAVLAAGIGIGGLFGRDRPW